MATSIDEIMTNGPLAAGLPDGAIPIHAVLLIEYVEPGSDDEPGRPRIAYAVDDDVTPWSVIGMCEFAAGLERDNLRREEDY